MKDSRKLQEEKDISNFSSFDKNFAFFSPVEKVLVILELKHLIPFPLTILQPSDQKHLLIHVIH